ncbi:DUF3592 domain-containing protein [Blastococcus goldschmidtiae]|uniref:DUF3592 domain-containing protein n=1 Tax=Blastococcus goldschmidtiae TaxID=3075546 RepID=A0ABU2K6L1_9ACTN|nr:DUF3592 domain-containing protein [Blastococcus sp. DSM 46792]MDT0275807.1 hypothetical protein [Blastococcus sp. DSM 46792]
MDSVRGRARLTPSGATGRTGTVITSPSAVRWRSRLGLRRVGLTGARVLSSRTGDRDGDVALTLALPDRSTAVLRVSGPDAAAVERGLTGVALPTAVDQPVTDVRVPRSWGAIGAVALGGLWMLAVGCLFLTGYWTTVTVTGGAGDGFCDIVWEDPAGQPRRGESDCYDEPAGSRFEVRVSGWPAAGEPTLVETYVGIGLVVGLPPFLLGSGRLLQLARRRRQELHDGTSTALHARGEEVADERTVRALDRERRWAWLVTGVGALGVGLVLTVMIVEIEADADLRAVGVTTVGTVVEVEPDTGIDAGSASVRFTVDGVTRARDVTLGGYADDYVAGDVVDVVYDPVAPDRFIIDDALYGPTWTGWLLIPSLLLAVAAPFGVARVLRVGRARRHLACTGKVPPRRDSGADGVTGLLDW